MAGHKHTGGDELLCESNSNTKKSKAYSLFEMLKIPKELSMQLCNNYIQRCNIACNCVLHTTV